MTGVLETRRLNCKSVSNLKDLVWFVLRCAVTALISLADSISSTILVSNNLNRAHSNVSPLSTLIRWSLSTKASVSSTISSPIMHSTISAKKMILERASSEIGKTCVRTSELVGITKKKGIREWCFFFLLLFSTYLRG